jgi:hypothetical protein
VAISVTVVLIFGEILPSALFTGPRQLEFAANMTGITWCDKKTWCCIPIKPFGAAYILCGLVLDTKEEERHHMVRDGMRRILGCYIWIHGMGYMTAIFKLPTR